MPDNDTPPSADEFLTEAETAALLKRGRSTLERWRATGEGPPWCRVGRRCVLYPRAGVMAWATARTYPHRAAELAGKVAA
jgi:predicted DNA-binding transcriptional regulator AlpA